MKRVFLSFHYAKDNWRVQQIKNIGSIDGQPLLGYNEWEAVKRRGDSAIKNWINSQMAGRSCVIVLVGSETANRKWINYEVAHAWDSGKSVVGLRIHNLKDTSRRQSRAGDNPFAYIRLQNGKTLASYIPLIDPGTVTSEGTYAWIRDNIEGVVEKAVKK